MQAPHLGQARRNPHGFRAHSRSASEAPRLADALPISGAPIAVFDSHRRQSTVWTSDRTASHIEELQIGLGEGPHWAVPVGLQAVLIAELDAMVGRVQIGGSGFNGAPATRREVHRASGVILVRLEIAANEALHVLRAHASSHGLVVLAVAKDVVAGRPDFRRVPEMATVGGTPLTGHSLRRPPLR